MPALPGIPPTARARASGLSALARRGFTELTAASTGLGELADLTGLTREELIDNAHGADLDTALQSLLHIGRRTPAAVYDVLADEERRRRAWLLLGASEGLGNFFLRHPEHLDVIDSAPPWLPSRGQAETALRAALPDAARATDHASVVALRAAYRRLLAQTALYDLLADTAQDAVEAVSATLADLASAAMTIALELARATVADTVGRDAVSNVRLAIIGMGKTGARELNYLSDVDVIFVAGTRDEESLPEHRAIDLATRMAQKIVQVLSGVETEPPLWEVDTALRPEGKQGALVRSLASHRAYYERWAQSWEFQALLKARPIAGDAELGADYMAAMSPFVWESSARNDFVDSVQRMRERVTEHLPAEEAPYEIKLGPGGIRDIEFTVQLLQLVHGLSDTSIRQPSTLDALEALVETGYIGRDDAAAFGDHYRALRLLEHRLQLQHLSRTHRMPDTDAELRILARATGLASSADELRAVWETIRREVRDIHVRLFYRPLLSAVAALPEAERTLSTDAARGRLAAIGFSDPAGALQHIGALTSGISRKSTIQRHLMPVMVHWFAEGTDPDYGLLAFRRISERLGNTPWFLRMLRDSSGAAKRITRVLTSSRFVGELMEWIPESVAWLDSAERLQPRPWSALDEEARAIQTRHRTTEGALRAVRALRRRELLRTAMGSVLDVVTIDQVAQSLTEITEATIQAALRAVRREIVPPEHAALDFSVIAMGRFGGAELGFGSDADVLYVYDANGVDSAVAQELSIRIVHLLRDHLVDPLVPLELDADLRPEGRNGPLVRSFDAYERYYRKWSLTWEAQALLRARGIAGSAALIARFDELADSVRYPAQLALNDLREIKRIKARVEGERLPQGVEPRRHLKLGPGTLSDVEWLVQLIQLQHAHQTPSLQTTSTLQALAAAVDEGFVSAASAKKLQDAWILASRLRSANTLITGQTSDVFPSDRERLDAMARILGFPERSAGALEEQYLRTTRRARKTFETLFYGETTARGGYTP
ncbi:bifunctional [glutamine synthetase] adenylyltransferase/[glutamine synthetase]-adenylyl-L-tyrosine phosphorylase [Microbacterium sp. YY-01]|uniref:bifunctional [glutamine synthetase] adenylyltransferase/[glutamine synthetase]-adenylyl-L-tyrosine phosphorylase n=1 Tax=Microbacterium sp. YY-01 TaxID=3421634 RepID=UPI003D17DFDF